MPRYYRGSEEQVKCILEIAYGCVEMVGIDRERFRGELISRLEGNGGWSNQEVECISFADEVVRLIQEISSSEQV